MCCDAAPDRASKWNVPLQAQARYRQRLTSGDSSMSRFRTATDHAVLIGLLLLGLAAFGTAKERESHATASGYAEYSIGDLSAPRPGVVKPGLVLVGGGDWPYDALRWMAEKAGHGHIVILRASGAEEMQEEFYKQVGGIASAQTFVFSDRSAASDPKVLDAIRHADGIFFAGGDQSNYVNYWRGTPLNEALNQHVRDGKPIGGTSAGLAILGAYLYGAMDGGSITSPVAMRDPLGKAMTLEKDFLHLPYLQDVITDSHFGRRDRLGRLIAFVANLRQQGASDVIGLGIDQGVALCIDGDGIGRVFVHDPGYAWVVQPSRPAERLESGKPLNYQDIKVTGVGTGSRLDLHDFSVESPAFHRVADVKDGRLSVREAAAVQAGSR
jgi:beta-aspartyl-peptidase (threonine type)